MHLRVSQVPKCLDQKLKLLGFEVVDLLVIFLTLSILNLIFGSTSLKLYFVWMPTLLLALTLRLGKHGKPENYLIHWIKFQMKEETHTAFNLENNQDPLRSLQMKRCFNE